MSNYIYHKVLDEITFPFIPGRIWLGSSQETFIVMEKVKTLPQNSFVDAHSLKFSPLTNWGRAVTMSTMV